MLAECIHGLAGGVCDICFPKKRVEEPKPVRAASSRTRAGKAAAVSPSRKSVKVADQRIYHVTHIRNLESILATGELRARANPTVDLSTPLTRELRSTVEVTPGQSVADFVPFYLAPQASLWGDVRLGAIDETRWSAAARTSLTVDFVVLVSTLGALGDDPIVADGDAAGSFTRFAAGTEAVGRTLLRLHSDEDATLAAEALAYESFPFDAIQLVGVANDRVRDRVKPLLTDASFEPRVVVYPPWFLPPEPREA